MDTMLNRDELGMVEEMALKLAKMTNHNDALKIEQNVSCKISFIMSLLENLVNEGHHILIFSQTHKMLNLMEVSFDLLEDYLEKHPEASSWCSGRSSFRENALFQDYHGLQTFREEMANFMEKIRSGRATFDADRIVLTADATAANELLTFILADPGDALLVPTPCYLGFDKVLRWRTRVNIIPIHCHSSNSFQLTLRSLEATYAAAEASNLKVRGLLITNPSNPLGTVASRRLLEDVIDFVSEKNIHLISDEIYSGSIFSPGELMSVTEIIEARGHHS